MLSQLQANEDGPFSAVCYWGPTLKLEVYPEDKLTNCLAWLDSSIAFLDAFWLQTDARLLRSRHAKNSGRSFGPFSWRLWTLGSFDFSNLCHMSDNEPLFASPAKWDGIPVVVFRVSDSLWPTPVSIPANASRRTRSPVSLLLLATSSLEEHLCKQPAGGCWPAPGWATTDVTLPQGLAKEVGLPG